jgi:uncharacterized membrane protein (DUF373 family)
MKIITNLTIHILIYFLVLILIVSVLELGGLILKAILSSNEILIFRGTPVVKEGLFFSKIQSLIAAVLLITIVIELIVSLAEYLREGSTNYVKIIVEITLIAILRHLIGIDLEHLDGGTLGGISAIVLVLGGFYYLLIKLPSHTEEKEKNRKF